MPNKGATTHTLATEPLSKIIVKLSLILEHGLEFFEKASRETARHV